jgi:hypothetical protein
MKGLIAAGRGTRLQSLGGDPALSTTTTHSEQAGLPCA